MYIFFKEFHSFLAYLVLAVLLFSIIHSAYLWAKNGKFSKFSKTLAILAMVGVHLQFIAGLFLYFISPLGLSNFSGEAMKVAITRLILVEHPLMMLLAIALITIGYAKAKRQTDEAKKHKFIVIFYVLGLILILSRIPWELWF